MSGRTAVGYYFPSLRSFIPAIFRKFVFGELTNSLTIHAKTRDNTDLS